MAQARQAAHAQALPGGWASPAERAADGAWGMVRSCLPPWKNGLDQRIDLAARILDGSACVDDSIGQRALLAERHLRIDAQLCIFTGKAVAQADAGDLFLLGNADHPDLIKHMRHMAFIQQRHIADDQRVRRVVCVQLCFNRGNDHGMQNGIELRALFIAGKDEDAQSAAVKHIAVKHAVAKGLADRRKRQAAGDGLDANGTLEISGGYTVVVGPTQGDTATLDYDKSGIITGGTFIGTGASGMAQSFSDSEQGVVAISVGNQSAGTKIVLKDKSGKTIIEHTPELNFAVVILSSPDITKGETYSITVGSQSGEFEAN